MRGYFSYFVFVTDDARYFQELLKKIENPRIRNAAKEVYIARERLEIGNMLGKGDHTVFTLGFSNHISTISSKYTSHHELSVLQPSNFSMYHICLLILFGAPSATALLQHGIPFLPPLRSVHLYMVLSAT